MRDKQESDKQMQRALCTMAVEQECETCNVRIVCEAELAGICVPVYAAIRHELERK